MADKNNQVGSQKRKASAIDLDEKFEILKKSKTALVLSEKKDLVVSPTTTAVTTTSTPSTKVIPSGPQRTSSLLAPVMLLSGHQGQIYCSKFSPSGSLIASGSQDKLIFLWRVYGECENIAVLKSHQGAILDLHWSKDDEHVYTASSDKTGAVFDVEEGKRIKRLRDHTSFVNSICGSRRGEAILVTGSDDCTAMIWDIRVRGHTQMLESSYQVLAACFSDDSTQVFTGGIDNDIKAWDLRTGKVVYTLEGHADSVTGLELSPDGSYLLSNGMDNTVRMWDVRPYVQNNTRFVNIFEGLQHDFQKNLLKVSWSPDGSKVSAGSADRFVYIWETQTRRLLYKLPGHGGSVNETDFHPMEPIILSSSDDKKIYLGEIMP